MRLMAILLLGISGTTFLSSRADDDTQSSLPPPGTWARYYEVVQPENFPEEIHRTTVKFLGDEEANGMPCRWLEVEFVDLSQPDKKYAERYLIPEKALQEDVRPMEAAVKGMFRDAEGNVTALPLDTIGAYGHKLLFLKSARKNAQRVNERAVVDYQSGKLTIAQGEHGTYAWRRPHVELNWEYTIWTDPTLPLDMAKMTTKLSRKRKGVIDQKWTIELTLEDFGQNATSAFPQE